MIGSVSTPACSPSWRSCSCAAGRRVSSEAIRTFLFWRSVSRLAILAVVVVLPEPCRPTIMMTTGAGALRSIGDAFGAEHLDQLVMDDLDDHLAGLDRLQRPRRRRPSRAPCR